MKRPAVVPPCLTLAISLLFLAAPLAVAQQQPRKVHRIGLLSGGRPSPPMIDAFGQGLRDLGYVEGREIVVEYRFAEGKFERLPDLAAELVRLKVDIILGSANIATDAAKQATTTTPIVMVGAGDPVGSGFVASLARPGGNITGLSWDVTPEIVGKRLELLKEAVPKASRVAVLSRWHVGPGTYYRELPVAARALGVKLQLLQVQGPDEFEGAFAAMIKERVDALIVLQSPFLYVHRTRITALAEANRLPAMYEVKDWVEAGGLMYYGPSVRDMFRRAATYVDKILKGAKPADLPVEQPTRFELVINLKTAKALGLTIPQSVLIRADEVIQ